MSGTITITGGEDDNAARQGGKRNKKELFKNCASFTDCISEINNTQVDNEKGLDALMPMHNLIEYSNNCSEISGSLW